MWLMQQTCEPLLPRACWIGVIGRHGRQCIHQIWLLPQHKQQGQPFHEELAQTGPQLRLGEPCCLCMVQKRLEQACSGHLGVELQPLGAKVGESGSDVHGQRVGHLVGTRRVAQRSTQQDAFQPAWEWTLVTQW